MTANPDPAQWLCPWSGRIPIAGDTLPSERRTSFYSKPWAAPPGLPSDSQTLLGDIHTRRGPWGGLLLGVQRRGLRGDVLQLPHLLVVRPGNMAAEPLGPSGPRLPWHWGGGLDETGASPNTLLSLLLFMLLENEKRTETKSLSLRQQRLIAPPKYVFTLLPSTRKTPPPPARADSRQGQANPLGPGLSRSRRRLRRPGREGSSSASSSDETSRRAAYRTFCLPGRTSGKWMGPHAWVHPCPWNGTRPSPVHWKSLKLPQGVWEGKGVQTATKRPHTHTDMQPRRIHPVK